MADKLFDEVAEDKKFDELTAENIQYVLDYIKDEPDEYNHCLILDDMTAYLKDKEIAKLINMIMMNRRHLHISIFFLIQDYKSLPDKTRKLCSNILMFKVNRKSVDAVFEENLDCYNVPKLISRLLKITFKVKHDFMFIDVENCRLFRNWDELVINDSRDGEEKEGN